jgi:RNA polymerase sporulation-specific sigma factor
MFIFSICIVASLILLLLFFVLKGINCFFLIRKIYLNKLHGGKNKIFYVAGGENLPAPLVEAKEKELIEMLSTERNEYAKSELTKHNLRLVVYIAKKFENTGVNLEDLISIGVIGLIKAINTFRQDKNIKLATYASRCIENEILMYLRRNLRTKNEISMNETLNMDCEGKELLILDILSTQDNNILSKIEDEMDRKLLSYAINKLSDRDKKIIQLRYGLIENFGEERTQKEVADLLGISQSYISRLEKRIITRLKKEIRRMA